MNAYVGEFEHKDVKVNLRVPCVSAVMEDPELGELYIALHQEMTKRIAAEMLYRHKTLPSPVKGFIKNSEQIQNAVNVLLKEIERFG
jgi:hypothetical protein